MKRVARVSVFFVLAVLFVAGNVFAVQGGQKKITVNGLVIDVRSEMRKAPAVPGMKDEAGEKKWIVQFTGPVQQYYKDRLAGLGCRIGDYLPEFAFIVSMNNKTKTKVEGLPFVNGVIRYKPEYKIDRKLKPDTEKFYVRIDSPESVSAVLSEVHKFKGKVLDVRDNVIRLRAGWAGVNKLARLEEVLWIEEATALKIVNDTTKWVIQTYVENDTKIWDNGIHGEGQIVGIGDTGLDYDMPWFYDPSEEPIGPMHRKVVGYDTTYGDDYDADWPGHGTHVAGIVGGNRTPVDGLSTANGMAPETKLFLQDMTPGDSLSVYPPSDLGDMYITTYDAGARIHTNSWGGLGSSYESLGQSLDRFVWNNKDFVVLFANGNEGPREGSVISPASAKNVISVGASLNGGGAESMASFSSNGPTADGRIKPTITAPGDGSVEGAGIISADSDGQKNSFNNGTISLRGTSMATPAAAGAAALVRQYFVEGYYPSRSPNPADALAPSAALVKGVLINSAQDMSGSYTDAPIPSTGQGWGRVNLSNVLVVPGDTTLMEVVDDATGLQTGEAWGKTFFSYGKQPLKITLVWSDYPGMPGAAKALVNDLDLVVTDPDGSTYKGNVFSGGESVAGGSQDRLNVEEQVLIKNPSRGLYTVTVTAYNIPTGPQPFALVVRGVASISSKGTIDLDKSRYNDASTVDITVADIDLNLDMNTAEMVDVTVAGTVEPYGEVVTLLETGTDTAFFTGSVPLAPAVYRNQQKGWVGKPGNGYLEVVEGDTITAIYHDVNDGTGAPAETAASAIVDNTAPVISSVSSSDIGDTYATVSWTTDEPANSEINYGDTAALGILASHSALVTQHSFALKNLEEAKTYYYEAHSTDEAGNLTADDNAGGLYSFSTADVPPELSVNSSNGLETYESDTMIFGITTDPSGISSVTVNGTSATYRPSDGYYEFLMPLSIGDNVITVISTDTLGNVAQKSVTVTRLEKPDLITDSVSGPTSALTGESIRVYYTVMASAEGGPSPDFKVDFYLSTDNVITPSDIYMGQHVSAGLQPWNSRSYSPLLAVPLRLSSGTYYIGAIADTTYDADPSNNALAGNQMTITGPDLYLTAVNGPAYAAPGENIHGTFTVAASPEGGAAPAKFFVGIYLSTDSVFDSGDTLIGHREVGPVLSPGSTYDGELVGTIPSDYRGTYYIIAVADVDGVVPETDETNNALTGNQIIIGAPDFVMKSVSGPTSASTGETITVSDTVSNEGGTVDLFSVVFWLSTDNVITASDTYIGYRNVNNLPSGGTSSANTTVTIPTSLSPGTYYIGATADPEQFVGESDETNNTAVGNQITITQP
jgi:hypothetical protein